MGIEFRVTRPVDLVDDDGAAVGRLRPGTTYVAAGRVDDWLVITGPTGAMTYVDEHDVVVTFEDDVPVGAPPPPGVPPPPDATAPAPPPTASSLPRTAPPRARRRRWPTVAFGLVAVAAVAVAAVLVPERGGDPDLPEFPVAEAPDVRVVAAPRTEDADVTVDTLTVRVQDGVVTDYAVAVTDRRWCGGRLMVPGPTLQDRGTVRVEDDQVVGWFVHTAVDGCRDDAGPVRVDLDLEVVETRLVGELRVSDTATGERWSIPVG